MKGDVFLESGDALLLLNQGFTSDRGLATIYLCGYWKQTRQWENSSKGLATIYLCGYWKGATNIEYQVAGLATICLCGYWKSTC